MLVLRLLLVIVGLAGVAGCASLDSEPGNRGSVFEGGVFGDLTAKRAKETGNNDAKGLIPVGGGGAGESQIYGPGAYADAGDAGAATLGANAGAAGAAGAKPEPAGAYRLNFENAEIRDVVHAVLGEALGLNYTISPDVAGTTSIASARAVTRDELLSTLEVVLASQGFSLTKAAGGVYRVGPLLPAGGTVDVGARQSPGYGVSVVPLRFVSVAAMSRLLGGFVTDAESLRIDRTKNALVVSGPRPKREEVVSAVLSFDQDWMAKQSVAIFELRRASPDAVVSELERVFDSGANGNANGAIQFKAIKRLKAVMAISQNASLIRRAETWAKRLDQENADGEGNVFIYRARYRDSKELAKIVGSLFGVSADTSAGGNAGAGNNGSGSSGSPFSNLGNGNSSGANGSSIGSGDGSNPSQTTQPGEQPIDNVTGAGDDQGAGQGGTATSDTPSPDVIDLTRPAGGEGANSGVRISADPTNNSVVVFADPETYRKILATLRELDTQPLQVAIQATIAEVRLNDTLNYGVQYYLSNGSVGAGFQATSTLAKTVPGFNFLLGSNTNPDAIISALDKITDVEILSSPSLVVMENQTANLQVGDDVPIQVSQRTSNDTSNAVTINEIEYRNTGILLKVTPRIGENGAVTMTIAQEISNVADASNRLGPTFSQRKVASQISVVSGQTVVLAGLISTSKDNTRNGLPLFSRIPVLRDATGDTTKKGARTELVVLIKPVVIHDGEDAQTVADDLRSKLWAIGQRERQAP